MTCSSRAAFQLTQAPVLTDHDNQVAVYDAPTSRRLTRIAATFNVSLDAAHAVATAILDRCCLVTRDRKVVEAVEPPGLEILDISETWD